MELKPGYKQTDAGVIPRDWDVKRLGEIGKVVRGGSPRPAGDPKFFGGDFIPWLTVAALTNIPDHQLEVRHTETRLTEEGSKRSRTLQPGTVIIANSGATLGIAKISTIECCANDGVAAIIDQHVGEKAFVCHCINAQTQRLREVVATGNGQPNLNTGLIKQIAIPWPPHTEQAAIAECISDLDKLLRCLEDAVVKKQRLKQAAMQELLTGKRRLPGFEGEWEVKRLGDLGEIKSGGTPSTSQPAFWDGGIPWCTPTDITALDGRKYLTTTFRNISPSGLQASSAELIPPQSLIMTTRATIGECAINTLPMTTNQGFKNIVSSPVVGTEFLYYLMSTQKQRLISLCGGSTFLEIGKRDLSTYEIRLPLDRAEQDAISSTLSAIDDELQALEASLRKAENLKQGMMQQLLTGKIRLE
jgi:type I restriction enzyme, S subunit